MMIRKNKKYFILIVLLFEGLAFSGCSFSFPSIEYRRGVRSQEEGDFQKAVEHFSKVVKRSPQSKYAILSSLRAGEIYTLELNDYFKALEFFRHVVANAESLEQKRQSQEKIADIYYTRLTDYSKAIFAFQKLLTPGLSDNEWFEYKFKIAKSYFYLNNFYQAKVELEDILTQKFSPQLHYKTLIFKGSVEMNSKKVDAAIETYQRLLAEFEDQAKKDNVSMNLALAFEEKSEFDKSIGILRQMKEYYPDPEFLDEKIARLKKRKANMPGAGGLRR